MRLCLRLAVDNCVAGLALDSHAPSVCIVVLPLQHTAELEGFLEDITIAGGPETAVKVGWVGGAGMWRLGGGLGYGVIVYTGIHQNDAVLRVLVETVDSEGLHIYTADFDTEGFREDPELDGTTPGIGSLDPPAVVVGILLEHDLGVSLWVALDRACHHGSQLLHCLIVDG